MTGQTGMSTGLSSVRPSCCTSGDTLCAGGGDPIRDGMSSKEIAALPNLSTKAIDFHRNNIRKKLGLESLDFMPSAAILYV